MVFHTHEFFQHSDLVSCISFHIELLSSFRFFIQNRSFTYLNDHTTSEAFVMIEGLFNFSLKEEEVLDGLFDFDHQFLTHFYLNTK